MFGLLSIFLYLIPFCLSATVTYDWDITWVAASPDGYERPVIGINGAWPCPNIEATVGDTIVVSITNQLGNETTGLHFHGISQVGTNQMDGPSGVTQCPVPPGSTFTYTFTVDEPGTYWYHSHNMGQYPDGLRGPLIVYDTADPYDGQYSQEIIITTSDWYHSESPGLINTMLSSSNPNALPPFPDAILLDDTSSISFQPVPGETYKVRLICMSAFASVIFAIDGHTADIIELDGVYTQRTTASQIRITPAQRYSFLLTAKNTTDTNYAFTAILDENRDYTAGGATWPLNATGYLNYDTSIAEASTYTLDSFSITDDFGILPYDSQGLIGEPDNAVTLNFQFGLDDLSIPRAYMNNITYVGQKVPTLYTALTTGSEANDSVVYGAINPFILQSGQNVQIVLNNLDAALHPFHLHGHAFQVVAKPASNSGQFNGDTSGFPSTPMRRDTVNVNANSYIVLRFVADNPGVQLFHCHIEWHVEMGLSATFIEAPDQLQASLTVPDDHYSACSVQGIPTAGNAAGNTANLTDLSGANTAPPNPDYGASVTSSATAAAKRAPTALPRLPLMSDQRAHKGRRNAPWPRKPSNKK